MFQSVYTSIHFNGSKTKLPLQVGVPLGGVCQRVKGGHSYKSPVSLFLFTFALGFHVFLLTNLGPNYGQLWNGF